jgi:hypothetical protein
MAGERRYLVHGLAIASTRALPLPSIETADVDVVFTVELGSPTNSPVVHRRGADATPIWVVERWFADGTMGAEFVGGVGFEFDADHVRLVGDEDGDRDLVAHLLLDHVIPRVVALRGDLMLHASGVVGPDGLAHLFLGATGAGKSTLATALARLGWPLLDDDGVRIIDAGDTSLAVPGYAGIRLLPDAAAGVLPDVTPGPPMAAGHPKRRFDVGDAGITMAHQPAVVAGVYVVERTDAAEPSIEPIGFAASVGVIAQHAFHLDIEPDALTGRAFQRSAALAASAPVFTLRVPTGLHRLPEVAALLIPKRS